MSVWRGRVEGFSWEGQFYTWLCVGHRFTCPGFCRAAVWTSLTWVTPAAADIWQLVVPDGPRQPHPHAGWLGPTVSWASLPSKSGLLRVLSQGS